MPKMGVLARWAIVAVAATCPAAATAAAVEMAAREGDVGRPMNEIDALRADPRVLRIQRGLVEAGLYDGPVDGRMSRRTEQAIRAFQKLIGAAVTGRATEALVERLETGSKVGALLKRLEQTRQEGIEQARQALLSQPETRELVREKPAEAADPTRDVRLCFQAPTVSCLLTEASESAKAIPRNEMRDWALGEVLVVQARAGLAGDAMHTAGRIADPRLIVVALRDIAEAQASAGRPADAMAAVDIIPDALRQVEALATIAEIQARRGDGNEAARTSTRLLAVLDGMGDDDKRVSFRARLAVILARAGRTADADRLLAEARRQADDQPEKDVRAAGLRNLAAALAELGRSDEALAVLGATGDNGERTPVLATAAAQRARAGDASEAVAAADAIESVRYRAVVLSRIAVALYEAGKSADADATLARAVAAADDIKLPYARSYARSRIALAQSRLARGAGGFDGAVSTAGTIADETLRAHTLWAIATDRRRAGDTAGATATEAAAQVATDAIKSTLSRVWMFGDLAHGHADAGETEAAWAAFRHGLAIAERIDNAWSRARALGKLAATLVVLAEAPTTAKAR